MAGSIPRVLILGLGNPGGASYKRGALTALQRHNVGAAALDAIASSLASAQPDSDDGSGSDSGGEDAAGGAGGGGAARPARGRKDAAAAAEWKVEKKLKASIRKVAMPLPPPLLRDYSSGHMSVDVAPSGAAGAAQPGAAGAPSEAELRAAAPLEVEVVLARPKTYMNLSGRAAKRVVEAEGLRADMLCVVHDELELPFGRVRLKNGGSHKGHNGLKSIMAALGTPDFWRLRIGIGRPTSRDSDAVADHVLGNFEGDELEALVDKVFDEAAEQARRWCEARAQGEEPRLPK